MDLNFSQLLSFEFLFASFLLLLQLLLTSFPLELLLFFLFLVPASSLFALLQLSLEFESTLQSFHDNCLGLSQPLNISDETLLNLVFNKFAVVFFFRIVLFFSDGFYLLVNLGVLG